jgi:peptide deformylase
MTHMNIFINPYYTLHQVSSPVHFLTPPLGYSDWSQFEKDYLHLMVSSHGIGLAANQIGSTKRFFGIGHSSFDEFKKPAILYNARIIKASEEVDIDEEGCLSFPGVVYNIYRPIEIDAEWQNMKGETQGATLKGYEARCFQHELDHLNGITFDNRAEENRL